MAEITAKMVGELRGATGLGMMDCKKALVEAEGDLDKAEEILRIKSGAKAGKLAGRTAAEGIIAHVLHGKIGAIVEVNCETDFVAKDASFLAYAQAAAQAVASANPVDLAALNEVKTESGEVLEAMRKIMVAKLGENISVRRFQRFETTNNLTAYMHGTKIGVLLDYTSGDEQLGRDVAMHIAAARPSCVSSEQVDVALIEKERRIYTEQALAEGKPADIAAKMIEGRVRKYLAEITLLGQSFVKNPDVTIEKLLDGHKASVQAFVAFHVGEGIEKKIVDYAAEVAAAAKV